MGMYLLMAGLGALGIEHAAYILQYGSIFNGLRAWSRKHATIYELLHCQLCTITQLSLWVWAVPVVLCGLGPSDWPWAFELGVVWLSQAALSLVAYDLARFVGRGTEALIQRARRESQ